MRALAPPLAPTAAHVALPFVAFVADRPRTSQRAHVSALTSPTLRLVSRGGVRPDTLTRGVTPNLARIANEGV
jgi:hypothetical protein